MRVKVLAALAAVAAGAGLLLHGFPTPEDRLGRLKPELEAQITARRVHVDPAELLDTLYNNNVRLRVLDLREEADFNLFHIIDSQRVPLDRLRDPVWVKGLPGETVTVLVSNDEARATEGWRMLKAQGVPNLYILEGGINHWLDVYASTASEAESRKEGASAPGEAGGPPGSGSAAAPGGGTAGPRPEEGAAPGVPGEPPGARHAGVQGAVAEQPLPGQGARPGVSEPPRSQQAVAAGLADGREATGAKPSGTAPAQGGNDLLRHEFSAALGSRHPAADPDPGHAPRRAYEKKIKDIGRAGRKAGGCG